MKALNLKGMSWIMALAMMFIVSFTSCSDDKEEWCHYPGISGRTSHFL